MTRLAWGAMIGAVSSLSVFGCSDDPERRFSFEAALSGANEVPPVATGGSGALQATLTNRQLELRGSFSNLDSDLTEVAGSPAHVHEGPLGAIGPILFNVSVSSGDRRNGSFTLSRELSQAEGDAFREGRYYVNVHTVANPGGEIRAQLQEAQPERVVFSLDLSGTKEVPPVATSAAGSAQVEVVGDVLMLSGTFQGLGSDLFDVAGSPAHVHQAPEGQAGPILFPVQVTAGADSRSGTFRLVTVLSPAQRQALSAGELYFNIHSAAYPNGELRAQLRSAPAT